MGLAPRRDHRRVKTSFLSPETSSSSSRPRPPPVCLARFDSSAPAKCAASPACSAPPHPKRIRQRDKCITFLCRLCLTSYDDCPTRSPRHRQAFFARLLPALAMSLPPSEKKPTTTTIPPPRQIKFVSTDGLPQTKRRRVTAA